MSEWSLPPWVINRRFTHELFALMFMKRNEKLRAQAPAAAPNQPARDKRVSASVAFQHLGIKVEKRKCQ